MKYNEYKNAEFWTSKALSKNDEQFHDGERPQLSLFGCFMWMGIGAAFIAALWLACFFDSTTPLF